MTLLKRLTLCLGLSILLVSCNNDQNAPMDDPALTSTETPAATTEVDNCQTAPDPGPCKASIEKYYFDQTTQKCTSFNYGGCQGVVPFETMETCQSACETDTLAANGCIANGTSYNVGDSWAQDCNTCTCSGTDNGPTTVCTQMVCDAATTEVIEIQEDATTTN